jgi:hypothetical protein
VGIVFVGVTSQQPGGNKERHSLIETETNGSQMLITQDTKAAILLPQWHASFTELFEVAIDGALACPKLFSDLRGTYTLRCAVQQLLNPAQALSPRKGLLPASPHGKDSRPI